VCQRFTQQLRDSLTVHTAVGKDIKRCTLRWCLNLICVLGVPPCARHIRVALIAPPSACCATLLQRN